MPALSRSDRSPLAVSGWLLVAAVMAFRLLPGLVRPGMFFDGVTHATIARNMAIGVGDVWHPVFSQTDGAGYHEQPPLGFLLESYFFRALGDHFWVEKLDSALTGLVTAALIAAIWRRLAGDRADLRRCDWLPVVLWAMLPGWAWIYENNMLENTLGLFAVAAVYTLLRAGDGGRAAPVWIVAGAAGIVAAVLSKGPVGLYPLVTPLVACFALRRKTLSRAVVESAALVALVCAALGAVCLLPGAAEYFDKYLHEQLFASLQGRREVVGSWLGRLTIIRAISKELILPAAVAAGMIWAARRSGFDREGARGHASGIDRRSITFCLLTAASASLPIMASPKQSGHYAFPSYAFYTLALALWCAPAVIHLLMRAGEPAAIAKRHRLLRYAAASTVVVLAAVSCDLAGRPHRDKDVYHDALVLGRLLPRSSIVGLSDELANDYPLQTNLARWDFIGADRARESHSYFLTAAAAAGAPSAGYAEVPTDMSRYRLFKRAAIANRRGKQDARETADGTAADRTKSRD